MFQMIAETIIMEFLGLNLRKKTNEIPKDIKICRGTIKRRFLSSRFLMRAFILFL